MGFSNSVRTTLEIEYNDEVRDLNITFDLMDRVRASVPWEQIAVEMSKESPVPDLVMMTKFVFLNLKEAGFKPDINDIYDEMMFSESNKQSYMSLAAQLLMAYQPRGKKKPQAAKSKKKK